MTTILQWLMLLRGNIRISYKLHFADPTLVMVLVKESTYKMLPVLFILQLTGQYGILGHGLSSLPSLSSSSRCGDELSGRSLSYRWYETEVPMFFCLLTLILP
jgi:hypothetical protein